MFSPPNRTPPGPGQESVWDYPRPPRLEDSTRRIRVVFNGIVIADSQRAKPSADLLHPAGGCADAVLPAGAPLNGM